MDTLQILLREVSRIVVRDKQEQEDCRKRGEYFNVFSILNLEANETRTHSAFIAELLNPKGSHGVGDAFLKAFLSILKLSDFDFDTASAEVQVEYHIGFKNEDATTGGRIDILITSKDKAILIENKIYAGDQENQLIRYFNFAKEKYADNFRLLYLTLNGHDASEYSNKKEDKQLKPNQDYFLVGYNHEMLLWLERCIELAACHPLVRETIRQYKSLIEQLTGKNMNENNNRELIALLTNAGNVEATLAILATKYEVFHVIKKNLLEQLGAWVENRGWKFNYTETAWRGEDGEGLIWIYKEEYRPWAICFRHETPKDEWYYGISYYETVITPLKQQSYFRFSKKPSSGWPFGWQNFNQYRRWDDINTLRDMTNGKVLKAMQEIIEPIMQDIDSGVIDLKSK
ncbi:hypothetical protein B5F77_11755 [Parabacteroides sp. An277]|uniref:PDDEXK-like family protein n=1 Tax=Parabacteroides sp. An277 TaxID=1965619 RepID=UPI000B3A0423|nr:PD-(D/E)XK nuclease family protein [Parabacteroides sp. An277]OUO50895.1 hypothetical protein B5F77_11755 [Parabacteroides sp. An277]